MTIDLTSGIVRILNPGGETTGTGFVVTNDGLIATCAHDIEMAGAGPGDSLRLVFHATDEEREARIEPDWWRDRDAEDAAILRLNGPLPEGMEPLPLGSSTRFPIQPSAPTQSTRGHLPPLAPVYQSTTSQFTNLPPTNLPIYHISCAKKPSVYV